MEATDTGFRSSSADRYHSRASEKCPRTSQKWPKGVNDGGATLARPVPCPRQRLTDVVVFLLHAVQRLDGIQMELRGQLEHESREVFEVALANLLSLTRLDEAFSAILA